MLLLLVIGHPGRRVLRRSHPSGIAASPQTRGPVHGRAAESWIASLCLDQACAWESLRSRKK
jgi:hypothetical protein